MQSPNNSNIIECLQSQILGTSDAGIATINTKLNKNFQWHQQSKFTSWVQSVENAAKLCNMDTLTIALSKLQGPHLISLFPQIQRSWLR